MTFARRPAPLGRFNRRGLGSENEWRPTGVPGCQLWLRGAGVTGVADGAAVTTWSDESGLGHSPTQATGTKRPLFRATGGPKSTPCVEFDGTDDFLRTTWVQNQPVHAFVVGKFLRVGGGADTMMDGSAVNGMRIASFDATRVYAQTSALLLLTATPTNWQRYEVQYNGVSGSFLANGGAPVTGDIGATAPGGICLGILGDQATSPAQCQIAEVILYDSIQSGTVLTQIRTYLSGKYA